MNISMMKLHTTNFSPDEETDALNYEFMKRLGMPTRYQPARLAIARSLANPKPPPEAGKRPKASKATPCSAPVKICRPGSR